MYKRQDRDPAAEDLSLGGFVHKDLVPIVKAIIPDALEAGLARREDSASAANVDVKDTKGLVDNFVPLQDLSHFAPDIIEAGLARRQVHAGGEEVEGSDFVQFAGTEALPAKTEPT